MLYRTLDILLNNLTLEEKIEVVGMYEEMWVAPTFDEMAQKADLIKGVLANLRDGGKIDTSAYNTLYLMTEPVKA